MKCISPPELDVKKLLAHLDHTADQETEVHLALCGYCHERAMDMDLFQNRIKIHLFRITCPSSMELGEFQMRMLPAPQMLVIAQHLRECNHCAQEIAQLENFLGDQNVVSQGGFLEKVKVLIARSIGGTVKPGLTGEQALGPAISALRGSEKGPLTLEADGVMIVLDIKSAPNQRWDIFGQVASDDQDAWTGASVELHQDSQLEFSTTMNDLGAFQCKDIPNGPKELRLIPTDESIVVVSTINIPD